MELSSQEPSANGTLSALATWERERSQEELSGFIARREASLVDTTELAL